MATTVEQLHTESDRQVGELFKTMLKFTFFMILSPIVTYFASRNYLLEKLFVLTDDESFIYSAVAAVIVIHLVLGAFIFAASNEANTYAKKKIH